MYLEHANITVQSIESTTEFLAAAFPTFRIRGEGPLMGDPGRWLHFGNDEFYLALQEVDRGVSILDRTYSEAGVNHLGFVVDNLPEVIETLEAAGFTMSAASSMGHHPHRDRAYFFDQCGFEWEFVQYSTDKNSERNDYSR